MVCAVEAVVSDGHLVLLLQAHQRGPERRSVPETHGKSIRLQGGAAMEDVRAFLRFPRRKNAQPRRMGPGPNRGRFGGRRENGERGPVSTRLELEGADNVVARELNDFFHRGQQVEIKDQADECRLEKWGGGDQRGELRYEERNRHGRLGDPGGAGSAGMRFQGQEEALSISTLTCVSKPNERKRPGLFLTAAYSPSCASITV